MVVIASVSPVAREADVHGAAPRIRFTDALVADAMARGLSHSPTFRWLVRRLTTSDLIVYIERRPATGRASGVTQFVSGTPQARYVRIVLDANVPDNGMVGLLGHELRHALEVADAPWVIDQHTYGELYRVMGTASCGAPRWCFDTTAAVSAGRRVVKEVASAGRRSRDLAATEE